MADAMAPPVRRRPRLRPIMYRTPYVEFSQAPLQSPANPSLASSRHEPAAHFLATNHPLSVMYAGSYGSLTPFLQLLPCFYPLYVRPFRSQGHPARSRRRLQPSWPGTAPKREPVLANCEPGARRAAPSGGFALDARRAGPQGRHKAPPRRVGRRREGKAATGEPREALGTPWAQSCSARAAIWPPNAALPFPIGGLCHLAPAFERGREPARQGRGGGSRRRSRPLRGPRAVLRPPRCPNRAAR